MHAHLLGDRPLLAADPALARWPGPAGAVCQTGAWLVPDERPLAPSLEAFLDAGEPPVYFGVGSMRAPGPDAGRTMIEAARALGRRAVLSRGWGELTADDAADCLVVDGDLNHRALFARVAAVVHHGGAGTTTAAARGGAPQVLLPQTYDQYYWADRVRTLGVGVRGAATTESLAGALKEVLAAPVSERARQVSGTMSQDGVQAAAEQVLTGG